MDKTLSEIDDRDEVLRKKTRRMSFILGAIVVVNMLIVAVVLSWRL
jgi:hypothetical protein